MVTPFDSSLLVDFDSLGRVIEHVVGGGVDYVVALGTTAETPTLSHSERAAVKDFIRERVNGRVPVVLGMGGNDTAKLCDELRGLDASGFAAVLSVAPYYNKPNQEGLYRHYKAVAEASPLPVILYNIPGRTGVNMTAETTLRIARECPGVIGMKEASGDLEQMRKIVEGAPEGFVVVSGDDAMTVPLMKIGGHGVISVMANAFPAEMARVVAGEADAWEKLDRICPLLFVEGNPTGIKCVLSVQGICGDGVRLPLVAASATLRSLIETEL